MTTWAPAATPAPRSAVTTWYPDALEVAYDWEAMFQETVARQRFLTMRGISLVISILFWLGIVIWLRSDGSLGTVFGWQFWTIVGVSTAISVASLIWAYLRLRQSRRILNELPQYAAMIISRGGVSIGSDEVPWSQVQFTTSRHWWRGEELVILTDAGPRAFKWQTLAAAPSAIDDAVRAFAPPTSPARAGIDFTNFDH